MTSRESKRRQRKRATTSSVAETKEEREARLKEARASRARQRAQSTGIVVYPLREWCVLRGISVATARRLIADGRVKVTEMSERCIGIRSDHDLEYLDSCARVGA
jgi:hypothetical protein